MQGASKGVGSTLRRARTARGVSIDEASRDTRIRSEFLRALEEDDFERLLGDVHARGCLRSYASYLGLAGDDLVGRYAKQMPDARPAPPASPPAMRPAVGAKRRRDNHRLFVMIAALLLILAASFGILSSRSSAPQPAALPSQAPLAETQLRGVMLVVLARQDVNVTVTVDDGAPQTFELRADESRSFEAQVSITVRLDHGASANIVVNGKDQGFPGNARHPWKGTFSYEEPSPSSSPNASG